MDNLLGKNEVLPRKSIKKKKSLKSTRNSPTTSATGTGSDENVSRKSSRKKKNLIPNGSDENVSRKSSRKKKSSTSKDNESGEVVDYENTGPGSGFEKIDLILLTSSSTFDTTTTTTADNKLVSINNSNNNVVNSNDTTPANSPLTPQTDQTTTTTTAVDSPNESSPNAAIFKAPLLWKDAPALIFIMRRPGCAVCRDEVRRLYSNRHFIMQECGIKMYLIVHQLEAWQEMSTEYWNGLPIFHDTARGFYKALGKGKFKLVPASVVFNPLIYYRWGKARRNGVKESFSGDWKVLGGLFIMSSYGVHYSYLERVSFEQPLGDILKVCEEVRDHIVYTKDSKPKDADVEDLPPPLKPIDDLTVKKEEEESANIISEVKSIPIQQPSQSKNSVVPVSSYKAVINTSSPEKAAAAALGANGSSVGVAGEIKSPTTTTTATTTTGGALVSEGGDRVVDSPELFLTPSGSTGSMEERILRRLDKNGCEERTEAFTTPPRIIANIPSGML